MAAPSIAGSGSQHQLVHSTTTVTSLTGSLPAATSAGTRILAHVTYAGAAQTGSTVKTAAVAFTLIGRFSNGTTITDEWWYLDNNAGASSFVVTLTTAKDICLEMIEVTGCDLTKAPDIAASIKTGTVTGTTATGVTASSGATKWPNELVLFGLSISMSSTGAETIAANGDTLLDSYGGTGTSSFEMAAATASGTIAGSGSSLTAGFTVTNGRSQNGFYVLTAISLVPAPAVINHVQILAAAAGGSLTVTIPSSTAGTLLAVVVRQGASTIIGCTDSAGHTWVQDIAPSGQGGAAWHLPPSLNAGGITSITLTGSGATAAFSGEYAEIQTVLTPSLRSPGQNIALTSPDAVSTGYGNAVAGDFAWSVVFAFSTASLSPSSPWSQIDAGSFSAQASLPVSTGGFQSVTWTDANNSGLLQAFILVWSVVPPATLFGTVASGQGIIGALTLVAPALALSGIVASGAAVAGTLTRLKKLAAIVASGGAASLSSIGRIKSVAAIIATGGNIAGTLGKALRLSGLVSSGGSVKGAMSWGMRVVISGGGAVIGALAKAKPLSGQIASGSGAVLSNVGKIKPIAAVIATGGNVAGALAKALSLSGTVGSGGGMSGLLARLKSLSGLVGSDSAVGGGLAKMLALAGTIGSGSGISGVLSSAGHLALGGIIATGSAVSGSVVKLLTLSGQIDSGGNATGSLARIKQLAGTVASGAAVSGTFSRLKSLGGTVASGGSIVGRLAVFGIVSLSGVITSGAAAAGSFAKIKLLGGDVASGGGITGAISRFKALSGQIVGNGSISGLPARIRALQGAIAGQGDAVAAFSLSRILAGIVAAAGAIRGAFSGALGPPSAVGIVSDSPAIMALISEHRGAGAGVSDGLVTHATAVDATVTLALLSDRRSA